MSADVPVSFHVAALSRLLPDGHRPTVTPRQPTVWVFRCGLSGEPPREHRLFFWPPRLRLRQVLVEEQIRYSGGNGIRFHWALSVLNHFGA
jgi:hypothetical protein